jgi:hypothetical protein
MQLQGIAWGVSYLFVADRVQFSRPIRKVPGMTAPPTDAERDLLAWLGREDFSQYGECHRPALDAQRRRGPDTLDAAKAGFRGTWQRPLSDSRSGRDMRRRQPKLARSAGASPAQVRP